MIPVGRAALRAAADSSRHCGYRVPRSDPLMEVGPGPSMSPAGRSPRRSPDTVRCASRSPSPVPTASDRSASHRPPLEHPDGPAEPATRCRPPADPDQPPSPPPSTAPMGPAGRCPDRDRRRVVALLAPRRARRRDPAQRSAGSRRSAPDARSADPRRTVAGAIGRIDASGFRDRFRTSANRHPRTAPHRRGAPAVDRASEHPGRRASRSATRTRAPRSDRTRGDGCTCSSRPGPNQPGPGHPGPGDLRPAGTRGDRVGDASAAGTGAATRRPRPAARPGGRHRRNRRSGPRRGPRRAD